MKLADVRRSPALRRGPSGGGASRCTDCYAQFLRLVAVTVRAVLETAGVAAVPQGSSRRARRKLAGSRPSPALQHGPSGDAASRCMGSSAISARTVRPGSSSPVSRGGRLLGIASRCMGCCAQFLRLVAVTVRAVLETAGVDAVPQGSSRRARRKITPRRAARRRRSAGAGSGDAVEARRPGPDPSRCFATLPAFAPFARKLADLCPSPALRHNPSGDVASRCMGSSTIFARIAGRCRRSAASGKGD
jgi:hypothetical protein